jgi:hypothetical protein
MLFLVPEDKISAALAAILGNLLQKTTIGIDICVPTYNA